MPEDQHTAMHTCFDDPPGLPCAVCQADFDATPAGIVQKAVDVLAKAGTGAFELLGDLLQILSDEMSDERAVEVEFPNYIPQYRWQVCVERSVSYSRGPGDVDRWTAALALARTILNLPNPNAVNEDPK